MLKKGCAAFLAAVLLCGQSLCLPSHAAGGPVASGAGREEIVDLEYQTLRQQQALLRRHALEAISVCDAERLLNMLAGYNSLSRNLKAIAEGFKRQQETMYRNLGKILEQLARLVPEPNKAKSAANAAAQIGVGLIPGIGNAAGAAADIGEAVNEIAEQTTASAARDKILAEATKQAAEIKKAENEWKDWDSFNNEVQKDIEDLERQFEEKCKGKHDAGTGGSGGKTDDTSEWEKVAKGGVVDKESGDPLGGTVVVLPGDKDGVPKQPKDDPAIKPGDTIIVAAPCHRKKVFVVGEDKVPSVLSLDSKPLRFIVKCGDEQAMENIRRELASQGITFGPECVEEKEYMHQSVWNDKWGVMDSVWLCEIVIKCYKKSKVCPSETGRRDGIGRTGDGAGRAREGAGKDKDRDRSAGGERDGISRGGDGSGHEQDGSGRDPDGDGIPTGPDKDGWYEPNEPRDGQAESVVNDPYFSSKGTWKQDYDDQWGLKHIGFGDPSVSLWPSTAHPVTVAVIDTGVDIWHPDLMGALWTNEKEIPFDGIDNDKNGYVDDVHGWNFIDQNNDVTDLNGHGTIVAGILAAGVNNGIGIAGVNPWARIMPLKTTDFNNQGWSIDVAKAIVYAVDHGARVINLSLGGKKLTFHEYAAVRYANKKGVLIVAAAGNKGVNAADFSPAGLHGVLTVSSTDMTDKRMGFSNWGGQIDLAAPGVDILSLRAARTDYLILDKPDYVPQYAFVGADRLYYRTAGSSFSAPFVSGVASLLWSVNPALTSEEVRRMLLYSAKDIDVPGKDQFTGFGLVDAKAALSADPKFFLDAEIHAAKPVQSPAGLVIEVTGTVNSDALKEARLEIGEGTDPQGWQEIQQITAPVVKGTLGKIPVQEIRNAPVWTIRVVARHKNGKMAQGRYKLKIG